MTLTKSSTPQTLQAIVSVASNTVNVGTDVDTSAAYGADVWIRMGRGTSSAFTVGPRFRLEGTYRATSPAADEWFVITQFGAALGASIGSQAVSGTSSAGDTTLLLAAGTNFAADDYIFIHNTTLANSEWKRVVSISTATLTLQEALVRAQTSATARNQAEEYHAQLDLTGINRLRLVVDGAGSGQAVIVAATYNLVTGL